MTNKAKERILKQVLQENKTRQIFRKTNNILPSATHTFFGKFGVLCFLVTPVSWITDELLLLLNAFQMRFRLNLISNSPWIHHKTKCFLMFSAGTEMELRPEID